MTFRMIPTRRQPNGAWFTSWTVYGSQDDARRSAREFFAIEDVPVLMMPVDQGGVTGQALGVFGTHKMRMPKRRK